MLETRGAKPLQGFVLSLMIAALIGAASTAVGDESPPPVPTKQPVASASGTVGLVADTTMQDLAAGGVVIPGVVVKRMSAAGGDPAAPPIPPKPEGLSQMPGQVDPSGAIGTVPAAAMPRTAAELAAAGVKAK